MNAPDPFSTAPEWWLAPWPLPPMPEPMTLQEQADEYQRDAIAGARDDEPAEDLG